MDVQSEEFMKAVSQIWSQAFSFANCAALKCALQLGIADAIHNNHNNGEAMSLSQLTQALQINPSKAPSLHRLMRLLVNAGYFSVSSGNDTRVYGLTPSSRLLLKNEPLNLRGIVLPMLGPLQIKAWNALSDWFKNDQDHHSTPFETAHGKNYWDYITEDPKDFDTFIETMATDSLLVAKFLINSSSLFDGLDSMVDVGGSTGSFTRVIAESFPRLKCTVLDLPHVVHDQQATIENLNFVAGDMFDKIPPATAIFLKMVLHDWDDENCVKILKNCKKTIPEKEKGGKVIIIDTVVESKIHDEESVKTQVAMDMDMLVLVGSEERTEEEYASLFKEAGFSDYKISPVTDIRSLILLYP